MSSKFTVMLCVHRSPTLLPFAMQTVLRQSHANFELFVVSDGSPPETIACANAFAARDPRVRVFDFPKGERAGEANRHVALAEATGEFVAHIADDDLWFPDHLKELGALLEQVELGNLILTTVQPDGSFSFHPGDLADPGTRERMLNERWNFFGPTVAGYRLSTYRRLPVGWSPAPSDVWPDLHMWRKFLRLDGIKVATRFSIQSIAIRTSQRAGITMQDRRAESEPWFNIVSDPDACSGLRAQIQEAMARHHAATTQRSLQRKSKIEAFAQRTAELKKHVSDRDTEIARRGKQVAERDAELVRLRSTVTNQDAALARLHQAAKEDRTEGGDAQADRAGDAAAGTPPVPSFDR